MQFTEFGLFTYSKVMRKSFSFLFFVCLLGSAGVSAADSLYHPKANAEKEIAMAIKQAKAENKHVLIQAGGNWCSWCLEFNHFTHDDFQLDSLLKANYVVCHLNYSEENKNYTTFKKYGFPVRFGFPVFLILDGEGKLLHTQNSAYLEEGKGYNKQRVFEFLDNWRKDALNEKNYQWLKN